MCDAGETFAHAVPSKSTATIDAPFDPAYYTWSLFFRALVGTASRQDTAKYVHNRSLLHEEEECKRCEKWRDWLMEYSPTVTFLRGNLEKLGGSVHSGNILCRRCDSLSQRGVIRGAFSGEAGILLCANHIHDRKTMEDVLSHEMVHAYDWMRFKYDKYNLKHAACTEIRAHLLSGECRWAREFFSNRNFKFTMHFQDCVRKKAALAVKMHPSCSSDLQAVQTVNQVWEACFSDTRPFDEVYR